MLDTVRDVDVDEVACRGEALPVVRATQRSRLDDRLVESDLRLVRLFAEGLPVEVIARRLSVSERTVRRHARGLCDRSGARAPIQLVFWAARDGLI